MNQQVDDRQIANADVEPVAGRASKFTIERLDVHAEHEHIITVRNSLLGWRYELVTIVPHVGHQRQTVRRGCDRVIAFPVRAADAEIEPNSLLGPARYSRQEQ